jgi:hypothetical protein
MRDYISIIRRSANSDEEEATTAVLGIAVPGILMLWD